METIQTIQIVRKRKDSNKKRGRLSARLDGLPIHLIVNRIFVYLNAQDLINVSETCTVLHLAASQKRLWHQLLHQDFCDIELIEEGLYNFRIDRDVNPSEIESTSSPNDDGSGNPAKLTYIAKYTGLKARAKKFQEFLEINKKIEQLQRRRALFEYYLRCFSLEFTTPLFGICPLLSFVFISLKLDRRLEASQMWVLLAPLVFLLVVLFISVILGTFLFWYKDVPSSFMYGMYGNFRGFIQFWMHKVFHERPLALMSGLVIFVCLFVFFILVGFKITSPTYPAGFASWNFVFIPFWIDFILFALAPCLKWGDYNNEASSFKEFYWLTLICLWAPLLAFCIMLPLWLEGTINAAAEFVLLPLMIVQALFILFPVASLCQALYNRKDISDSILVVGVMCIIFTPLVVFEVLLALLLNNPNSNLNFVKVFIPLIVWFGLTTLALINFLLKYSRPELPADLSPQHPLILRRDELVGVHNNGADRSPSRRNLQRMHSRRFGTLSDMDVSSV